jgi:hypothetical protein
VDDFLVPPNRHSYARNALVILKTSVVQLIQIVVYDLIDLRQLRQRISFLPVNFFRSHSVFPETNSKQAHDGYFFYSHRGFSPVTTALSALLQRLLVCLIHSRQHR